MHIICQKGGKGDEQVRLYFFSASVLSAFYLRRVFRSIELDDKKINVFIILGKEGPGKGRSEPTSFLWIS